MREQDLGGIADGFVVRCLLPSEQFGNFRPGSEVERDLTGQSRQFWNGWVAGVVEENSEGLMAGQRRDLVASVVRATEMGSLVPTMFRADMSAEELMEGFVVRPVVNERERYLCAADLPSGLAEAVRMAVGAFCLGHRAKWPSSKYTADVLGNTLKRVGVEKFSEESGVEQIMSLLKSLEKGWEISLMKYKLEQIDGRLCDLMEQCVAPVRVGR